MDHNNEKKAEETSLDLDDILPAVGEFGTYQKRLLFLICLPACFPCGFCAFNQLFMANVPEHWCNVPELRNFSEFERKSISIPLYNSTWSSCYRYAVNYTKLLEDAGGTLEGIEVNTSWPLETCVQGWEYDRRDVKSSIVIDFDLVCEKDIYPTLGLVALNVGGPIGVYFFGSMNDIIGRKKTFFMCLSTLIAGSIFTAFSPGFWWWTASRAIVGLTIPAMYQIPFIISLEMVGPNYRSFTTVCTCVFYTTGLILLSGITYLVRDWVYLNLVSSLPFLLFYLYWFFLPESPRWLLARGKFEEASRVLETLARVNQKELPTSFKQQLKQKMTCKRTVSEEERLNKSPGLKDLFRTPNMRLKTLLITLNWFASESVYVGLSYYGPALGSSQYISFLLSSAVEIPSYLTCLFIMDKWGRRWPLSMGMIVSGILCIATVLIPSEDTTSTLIMFLFSKAAISSSFLIIYPFTGELYPTNLRGIGLGVSAYVGGLGLIIIPFINYLGSEMLVLPLIVMGSLSVLGGLTSLRLPETLHHKLPQTAEEGEEFGKNFTMADCLRCIPLKPSPSTASSYEDLELVEPVKSVEEDPLEQTPLRPPLRMSMKKLVRQQSVMDTQKSKDGTMQMTYWF